MSSEKHQLYILFFLMTLMLSATLHLEMATEKKDQLSNIKVTILEFGTVRCTKCQKMVSILKEIEKEYHQQVKVIFYDFLSRESTPYKKKYKIKMIPVQVRNTRITAVNRLFC